MLAVACWLRRHIKQKVIDVVDAGPSPPHFYCFYIYNTIVRLSIVSIFIHVYFLVKPLEIIF